MTDSASPLKGVGLVTKRDFAALSKAQEKSKGGRDFAAMNAIVEEEREDRAAELRVEQSNIDRSGLQDTFLRFQLARADSFE